MEITATPEINLVIPHRAIYEQMAIFPVPYQYQTMIPIMATRQEGNIGLRSNGRVIKNCPGATIKTALEDSPPLFLKLLEPGEGTDTIYLACFSQGLFVELLPAHLDASKNIQMNGHSYRPKVLLALMVKIEALNINKSGYFDNISVKDAELWIDPYFNSPKYLQTRVKRAINRDYIKPLMAKGVPVILKEHIWEKIFTPTNITDDSLALAYRNLSSTIKKEFETFKNSDRIASLLKRKTETYNKLFVNNPYPGNSSPEEVFIFTPI